MQRTPLNAFEFPSDTDFRLLLLIAAVIGSALFIYNWIYFDLPQSQIDLSTYERCAAVAHNASPNALASAQQVFEACRSPVERRKAAWMVGGVGLIFVLAIVLYIAAPEVKRRRQRLVPLTSDDIPDVVSVLDELQQRAGLRLKPQFLWNPMNGSAVGIAFGRRGRYFVALTGGLVTRFYSDRAAFESVVLHELGHLRNGDVDKTYLAIGIWQAFVIAGLIPLAATVVFAPSLGIAASDIWLLGWRSLAVAALVYLVRSAVLRAREIYADLRAAEFQGSSDALMRALGSGNDWPKGIGRWRSLLLTHPSMEVRRRVLLDPRPLFAINPWTAFAAGLAAGIAYPSVVTVILLMFTGTQSSIWYWTTGEVASLIASAALCLLIAGVVGVGLWRATFAALVDPSLRVPVALIAGATAIGIGLGGWVAFDGGFPLLPSNPFSLVSYFLVYAALIALLGLGFYLVFVWFDTVSKRSLRGRTLVGTVPAWWPGFVVMAVVLVCWMGATLQARDLLQVAAGNDLAPWTYLALPLAAFVQAVPLGLIALGCLVFYSVIATPARPERPAWTRSLLFALVAAVAYLLVAASLRKVAGPIAPNADLKAVVVFAAEIGAAIVVQGCLAVIVAIRSAVMPFNQAFTSAIAAGVLMALVAFSVNVAAGGRADGGALFILLSAILVVGGAASASLAWLTTALSGHAPRR